MAFGYDEPSYIVLEKFSHPARGSENTQHYELRQEEGSSAAPYIALFTTNPAGLFLSDQLLCYTEKERVAMDWKKLISPEKVSLSDLGFAERIVDHQVGYSRNGGATMY